MLPRRFVDTKVICHLYVIYYSDWLNKIEELKNLLCGEFRLIDEERVISILSYKDIEKIINELERH